MSLSEAYADCIKTVISRLTLDANRATSIYHTETRDKETDKKERALKTGMSFVSN